MTAHPSKLLLQDSVTSKPGVSGATLGTPGGGPLNAERLRQLIDYDPTTGKFRWRINRGLALMGNIAGSLTIDGYRKINADGRSYRASHLAWLYIHGHLPNAQIDHKNCKRDDDRIENLRLATRSQNNANSLPLIGTSSGLKGVSFHKRSGRWQVRVKRDCKRHWIGYFDTAEEAHAAYVVAAQELHGEFARAA